MSNDRLLTPTSLLAVGRHRAGMRRPAFTAMVLAAVLLNAPGEASAATRAVPAGTPMEQAIRFQYAVYYLPAPTRDPVAALQMLLRTKQFRIKSVSGLPRTLGEPLVSARLEKDVAHKYAPPDMKALQYFGRGLSREQAQALQDSREALILNFGHASAHVWSGARAATELVELVARETAGLVWDEETREIFTPDEWHKRRVAPWTETVPDVSRHITIHAYQDKEYVRAITLGMVKFGLPDVVVQNFSWSSNNNMGNLLNAFCQAMAEGARFAKPGAYDLDLRAIRNAAVRDRQVGSRKANAKPVAHLTLVQGAGEEGDPRNRLIEITFDRYPGVDVHARQDALLSSLYGWEDAIKRIRHDDELEAASRRARAKLPTLRAAFAAGLAPGEFIQVKAPFATPKGDNEWMWVEITEWKGKKMRGLLKNEPFDIPDLHGGQLVPVNEDEVFDYIRNFPNGTQEGNETGKIIEKMRGDIERSK